MEIVEKEYWYHIDEEKWKNDFSNKLTTLIREKGVSINKTAKAINVDSKTLRNYIECKSIPSAIIVMKLAKYFNVGLDYIVSLTSDDIGYSDETIMELASIIKSFDVLIRNDPENNDSIILKINDKTMSAIIKELYLTKEHDNYNSIAKKLAQSYGKMKVYNKALVDYATFQNSIRQEFIFREIDDDLNLYEFSDGTNGYIFDDIETADIIAMREDEWDEMTTPEREVWWEKFCKENERIE